MSTTRTGCLLCPRNCAVSRAEGRMGVCGQTDEITVARAALHYWEEPCISGGRGSGTVFFAGCALGCVFCQNYQITSAKISDNLKRCKVSEEWAETGQNKTPGESSTAEQNRAEPVSVTVERLAEIFLELQRKGAHNINLVTPDHFVPQIAEALAAAKKGGLVLPIVYNTGSYVHPGTLRRLEGMVDIWLPDFKYMNPALSAKYSCAPDYPGIAKTAIAEMVRQSKGNRFEVQDDPESLMKSGVIVRHLILPGCTADSKAVIRYLYETYGDTIYLSIMNQFTPTKRMSRYPELNRKVTKKEYSEVVDYAIGLGVECGFIQEGDTADESFIPTFDGEGVR